MTPETRRRVSELAHRAPIFIAPGATLREVAHELWAESVGALLVGDERHVLGVISERDVTARLAQGADPDTATAESAMTKPVVSARPNDALVEIAIEMLDDGIRHIPVIEADGRVHGVVSMRDLVRPLLIDAFGG